jgi:hypothetical protein
MWTANCERERTSALTFRQSIFLMHHQKNKKRIQAEIVFRPMMGGGRADRTNPVDDITYFFYDLTSHERLYARSETKGFESQPPLFLFRTAKTRHCERK